VEIWWRGMRVGREDDVMVILIDYKF